MFTKTAIALAIVFCTATGTLAATKKHHTGTATHAWAAAKQHAPTANGYNGVSKFDQRSNYSDDWSFWHRYDGDLHD